MAIEKVKVTLLSVAVDGDINVLCGILGGAENGDKRVGGGVERRADWANRCEQQFPPKPNMKPFSPLCCCVVRALPQHILPESPTQHLLGKIICLSGYLTKTTISTINHHHYEDQHHYSHHHANAKQTQSPISSAEKGAHHIRGKSVSSVELCRLN